MRGRAIPGMPGIRRFKEERWCFDCDQPATVWVGRDENGEEMFGSTDHECSA